VTPSLLYVCVLATFQHTNAFSLLSAPLLPRERAAYNIQPLAASAKLSAARVSLRKGQAPIGALGLSAGIYSVVDYKYAQRPEKPDSTKCACGSGMSYTKCCEEWHDRGEAVDPLILIKSRYSAFAYCLPEYIIATTQKKGPEWQSNTKEWEEELLEFSKTYGFQHERRKLGAIIEQCNYQNDNKATLLFKALMLNKKDSSDKIVELWEKSTVVREGNYWVYQKGCLEEYSGPLA